MVKRCAKPPKKTGKKTPKIPVRPSDVAAADDENYDESYREYVARSDLEDFEDDDIPAERETRPTLRPGGPWL